jgi:hypothetical protein
VPQHGGGRKAAAGGLWQRELKLGGELKLVVGPHRGGGADAVTFPSLWQACHQYRDELE